MTSKQKAIKEANKMADLELIKSKFNNAKKQTVEWLQGEADGFKRWHIILFAVAPFAVAYLVG